MPLMLNCDLGESTGSDTANSADAFAMPHIDQASIACGFHAGGPLVMNHTLALAKQHGVAIGAHPSYFDPEGFGRRSMSLSRQEIMALLLYQMSALEGMSRSHGLSLSYVKPHGALYNDMMANSAIRHAIMDSVAAFHTPIHLMLQATPDFELHRKEAAERGLELYFEAFADRCYDDNGLLLPRNLAGAVHNRDKMLAQVEQLHQHQTVTTSSGKQLPLKADSLCVHGDNPEGVDAIAEIRRIIHS